MTTAFISLESNGKENHLRFRLPVDTELPHNLLSASVHDFYSVLSFSSKLLESKESLSKDFIHDRFFDEAIQKTRVQLTEKFTESESELKLAHERELRTLRRQISELQAQLQQASSSEQVIRQQEREAASRLLQVVEEKNSQLLQLKEAHISQREALLVQKEAELQTKITRQSSSSLRGQDGETYFSTLAKEKQGWDLTDTRKIPHACDYQGTIHSIKCFFEVKHYTSSVPQKEITKFHRDLKEHPEAQFAAFISLDTNIQGRNPEKPIIVEWLNESQCVVYIQSCSNLDTDFVFCTLDQIIQLAAVFNRTLNTNQATQEPIYQTRIEQAKSYIEGAITRTSTIIRKLQTEKKQIITILDSNLTTSMAELHHQSAELVTGLQKLLGAYAEETAELSPETPPPVVVVQEKKTRSKPKKQLVQTTIIPIDTPTHAFP